MGRRARAVGGAALALALLGGCARTGSVYSNFREVEDLLLVETLGYDRPEGRTALSVACGSGAEQPKSVLLTGEGVSITQATERLRDWSSREDLFFAHIQYVAVGEEAARRGLEDLLDWFERGPKTRLDLPLFVTEGDTAQALVTDSADEDYDITSVLLSLQRDAERQGESYPFTLLDMAQRLARSGSALCCSVRREATGQHVPSAGEEAYNALLTGFAVFKDGALLCYTGPETARGICLLLNLAGTGTVPLPDGRGGTVTVALDGGETELEPTWSPQGELTLRVRLDYRAGVVEADTDDFGDAASLAALDARLSAWLEARAREALELSCATGADFLELGRLIERRAPVRFAALDWEAELPALRYTVEARGVVERSYDLGPTANTRGEGRDHV